jgi:hypothetical protein
MCSRKFIGAALSALVAFVAPPVEAATVTVSPDNVMVTVDGELTMDDVATFEALTRGRQDQGVQLKSPGGAAIAGVRLGEIVRARKMVTFVMHDTLCASACAIAWLGGVVRAISTDHAGVGFHGVYNADTLQPSGAGNAIVGAFLGKLGLSDAAIAYITNPGAQDMQWLTAADARALGIDATAVECRRGNCTFTSINTGASGTIAAPPREPQSETERSVATVIERLQEVWSGDPERYLQVANDSYEDTVHYYGKYQTRDQVLADKRKFVEKWPRRDYRIRPGTLMVTCTPGANLCTATGTVDFSVSSAVKTVSGVATFEYSLEVRGPGAYISTEGGKVLQRRTSTPQVSAAVDPDKDRLLHSLTAGCAKVMVRKMTSPDVALPDGVIYGFCGCAARRALEGMTAIDFVRQSDVRIGVGYQACMQLASADASKGWLGVCRLNGGSSR